MSLLSWFSPKKKREAPESAMESSGLSRLDSTKPFNAARQPATAQPANRKQERMARREVLYAVVREAMVRAGVLSSSYKFKVLSLDPRGRQFMVMVDLAQGSGSDTNRLAEIEAMVAQSAKARYDILVTAVYWRANEHVAVGDPAHPPRQRSLISQPMPLQPSNSGAMPLRTASGAMPLHTASGSMPLHPASGPMPLHTASGSMPLQTPSGPMPLNEHVSRPAELRAAPARIEPLHPDEVAAFRKALDAGVRGEQALAAATGKTAQSYTLLTGFEDTEMASDDDSGEHLSGTQYGALR